MNEDVENKKRVLHIIHGFGAGGAETWLLALVKYLKLSPNDDFQFDFLITGGKPLLYDDEVIKYGARIYYIEYSLKKFLLFRSKFISVLKQNKYIAIHDHQDFITGWHLLAGYGNLPSIKISHLHNPYNFVRNYVTNIGRWLSFKLGRILMASLTSKITGTSAAVMDEYKYTVWPYVKKRVSPAYCGFDTYRFKYDPLSRQDICRLFHWSTTSKIALFVGRIGLQDYDTAENQKNPSFALNISKRLVSLYPEWKFLFVGYKGKEGERMEEEIRQVGLEGSIKFMGIRNDIPNIMSASDILVFPSLYEGLGMVVVEAQANGLPIIMSENIPVEAVVFNELVTIRKLSGGIDSWCEDIAHISQPDHDRSSYFLKMLHSPFSIENSAKRLFDLYNNS